MSSKVIVSIPSNPLKQINKTQDLVDVDSPKSFGLSAATDPIVRVNQLEQNIRFLQEQHRIMLNGLHSEIETLRQRNRDLQFQVLFSKDGVAYEPSSGSSSEEDVQGKGTDLSPQKKENANPPQLELMERNIEELKANLNEANMKNLQLQNTVDEQKKKLLSLENDKLVLAAVGNKIGKENNAKSKSKTGKGPNEELQERLDDADRLIRRLRRENEEQRKEIVSLRMAANKNSCENKRLEGNNTYRGYSRHNQFQTSRFPPLHGNWKNNTQDFHMNRNPERDGNRLERNAEIVGHPVPNLPHLRERGNGSGMVHNNMNYNNYSGGNYKRGYYYHRKMDERTGNRTSRREQIFQPNNEFD